MKTIIIKLTKGSNRLGPFDITDQFENVIATDVSIYDLISGVIYEVDDAVSVIKLSSTGFCKVTKMISVSEITQQTLTSIIFEQTKTACLWKHLIFNTFNKYYGVVEPYVLEYPVSVSPNTEILQSIKSYDKVELVYFHILIVYK
jgi:hypothetical protein